MHYFKYNSFGCKFILFNLRLTIRGFCKHLTIVYCKLVKAGSNISLLVLRDSLRKIKK